LLAAAGLTLVTSASALIEGCSAAKSAGRFDDGGAAPTSTGGGGSGGSLFGGAAPTGGGGTMILTGGTGPGGTGTGGSTVDPCASECGPTELCDGVHAGIDDNCNGIVDEGCPCSAGLMESCFKGEPHYRDAPGCFPGTQKCDENGHWGECVGGVHATDHCYQAQVGCHAIQTYPFVATHLKDGTGNFSAGATTETWTVACPAGITCPAVSGANPQDSFQPLQSGEYSVTYTRSPALEGQDSCTYPLLVGAPGFRVELDWEHTLGGTGVDLDLHVHKPADTQVWGGNGGTAVDCAWDNCTVDDYPIPMFPMGPEWWGPGQPPNAVNWYLDPVDQKNTCYYAPRGVGDQWRAIHSGCHNPRLDLDNITCDPAVQDVNSASFCAPENINIDFPPKNQWIRIGVHYYFNQGKDYDVHPRVRIFCNAEQVAEIGPAGYNATVTFTPADGAAPSTNLFWLVADVRFLSDPCIDQKCEVKPLYLDANAKTPLLTDVPSVQASYGPPYPNP